MDQDQWHQSRIKIPYTFYTRETESKRATSGAPSYRIRKSIQAFFGVHEKIQCFPEVFQTDGPLHREVSEKYETFRDVVLRLAQLDCLLSLAAVASQPDYVKPRFSDHVKIKVVNGRHPMAEKFLGSSYVPNDIDFDASITLIVC